MRLILSLSLALALAACASKGPGSSEFPRGTALPPPSDEPANDPGEAGQP